MTHVAILGAGISGLSLAWFLKKRFGKSLSITLIEKEDRVGGWIQTAHRDGFLFEQGPRGCRPKGSGVVTLELVEELGLQDQVILSNPFAQDRYLYDGTKLQCVPKGVASLLLSPLRKGMLSALTRDWFTPPTQKSDETIYDFFSRRFSSSFADQFIDPLVSGIYAGDIRRLSLRACFPMVHEWEQEHGSVVWGALKESKRKKGVGNSPFIQSLQSSPLFSFAKGMEALPKEIARQLDAEILLRCSVEKCLWDDHSVTLMLSNGQELKVDHLFSSISITALMPLGERVKELASVSVAVVNLAYRKNVLPKVGFGYLIPSVHREEILGVVWDSCLFPSHNGSVDETRVTVMIGGAHHLSIDSLTEEECLAIAMRALKKHLNITDPPSSSSVKIARHAIPQYSLGYHEWRKAFYDSITSFCPKLTVFGSAFGGVSVNDCIANAKRIAAVSSI